ncbi:signal recognition particle-docking protein FtsY [Treponema parvum]|uniref:Signal recognition particle receptor FtsY n=1 Tax=Treponema parvum TaxID=138851 RepID=A0A975F3G6_9SPIR|nr:signal recognition particle-docking protein FtsY [Treponema parvum]QTQ13762.1 signal recognition particle-docking protein FtsY [Treponema parvum]
MAKISFASKIKSLFSSHDKKDDVFFEDLTDALIEGDVGAKTSFEIVEKLEQICRSENLSDKSAIMQKLAELLSSDVKSAVLKPEEGKTNIWMVLGVNGVGKTTTAAKMASYFTESGFNNVILAAADTFRAAAIEQLIMHGKKLNVRVIHHQSGSDPSAVVFDAAESVNASGGGLVIADTAGRLHNKENLVRELQKIDKISFQKASPGCYKKLLVVDATTGQNALRQAEVFNEAVGLDAIILTKYDSTAKGGIAVSICKELGIPVAFVCTGEKYDDISLFDVQSYVYGFIGE